MTTTTIAPRSAPDGVVPPAAPEAQREHDTADRRVVFARASADGTALVARFREVGRERMRHILGYLPDEALPSLVTGLRALTQAVERADAELAGRSQPTTQGSATV